MQMVNNSTTRYQMMYHARSLCSDNAPRRVCSCGRSLLVALRPNHTNATRVVYGSKPCWPSWRGAIIALLTGGDVGPARARPTASMSWQSGLRHLQAVDCELLGRARRRGQRMYTRSACELILFSLIVYIDSSHASTNLRAWAQQLLIV